MSPRPPEEELLSWALSELQVEPEKHRCTLESVAGDASNRCYFRLGLEGATYILVAAPPQTEKNAEFLAVRELLERGGVTVPALYGADLERGFLLLGDLGHRMLLPELKPDTADSCYREAFAVLYRLAGLEPEDPVWPTYDTALLNEELSRFPRWFVAEMLGYTLTEEDLLVWQPFVELLVSSALEQPRVLVHRDFHSRNLMPQADGSLGVIDFQDAVTGPVTYDLVSLLRDCYISWPVDRVRDWALEYHREMRAGGRLVDVTPQQFLRWFDLMGLQRHIKVLGTFARLYLRDGKEAYLDDLPLVVEYVQEMLLQYREEEPAIAAFDSWFRGTIEPLVRQQDWSGKK